MTRTSYALGCSVRRCPGHNPCWTRPDAVVPWGICVWESCWRSEQDYHHHQCLAQCLDASIAVVIAGATPPAVVDVDNSPG